MVKPVGGLDCVVVRGAVVDPGCAVVVPVSDRPVDPVEVAGAVERWVVIVSVTVMRDCSEE